MSLMAEALTDLENRIHVSSSVKPEKPKPKFLLIFTLLALAGSAVYFINLPIKGEPTAIVAVSESDNTLQPAIILAAPTQPQTDQDSAAAPVTEPVSVIVPVQKEPVTVLAATATATEKTAPSDLPQKTVKETISAAQTRNEQAPVIATSASEKTSIATRPVTPVTIVKSPQQIESELLNKVDTLLKEGKSAAAQQTLRTNLADNSGSYRVTQKLLDLLIAEQQFTQAQALINDRQKLGEQHPLHAAKIIQLTQGDQAALQMLASNRHHSEQTLALYAGLLQKLKLFNQAEINYQQLTKDFPDKGVYWLGLALALDSQSKLKAAHGAYLNAYTLGGHSAGINGFIKQRIDSLNKSSSNTELAKW